MAFLDVRSDPAAGHEPLSRIMETVAELSPDEPLELLAPFIFVPLYDLMEARGYVHTTQRSNDGSWHVRFRYLHTEE